MSTARRVLVTPRSLTAAGLADVPELEPLRERGYELVGPQPGRMPTAEDLRDLLPGCVGWLAGVEPITAELLAHAPDLRVISRNGAGTDAIDLDAAARAGVAVVRAVGANAQGVAELVLALTMSALRHVVVTSTVLRGGRWERPQGAELTERRVGLVGLGEVGRRAAAMFGALGVPVVAYDPYVTGGEVPVVPLDELLRTCDVVSLSCPPPAGGRPLLGADEVATMVPGTVLVNTARSALVDDDAILAALEEGRLSAYAVDAFDTEPPAPSPLLAHQRVIATPHLGGYTGPSVRRATTMAVTNLVGALEE
jgi:D-3-phosphoglycerate dehydrogenase / 2-oxoglutarate reductase